MATCSRCGQPVEFRYVDGRCIPLHLYGGCGGSGGSTVRDFSGYSTSPDSCCFKTICPSCGEGVFFIRHNGGSVWIDPPLGPPWEKHPCMDGTLGRPGQTRSFLVSSASLATYKRADGLIVGVVKEAETAFDGSFTLINIETGEAENFYVMVKNKAGFLVGRLVIYDADGATVKWLEDGLYSFAVIAPVRVPKPYRSYQEGVLACPDCETRVKVANLGRHLGKVHGYLTV